MINIEIETQKVIESYVNELKKEGLTEEIELIEMNILSSDKTVSELIPRIVQLQDELHVRNRVLDKLITKRDVAVSSANNAEIGKLQKAIAEVTVGDFTSTISKKFKNEIDNADRLLKKSLQKNKADLSLQEIMEKFNYHLTGIGNLYWYFQSEWADEYGNRQWYSIKKDTLLANHSAIDIYIRGEKGEADYSSFKEFNKLLINNDRKFTKVVQSYNSKEGCHNGILNIMQKEFCPPIEDGSTDYHWFLDAVVESISGGKEGDPETFDSFQKTIFAKYLHPDNIYLPNLFLNDDGSSGKSLYITQFCTRLFNGQVANNCNIDHITGKFNGYIAGKAIIFANETARDKVDVEKIKQFLGSPTFMVEEKFEKPYECDNTGLLISASNPTTGGITLSGKKADRRYSIFSSQTDIHKTVVEYFKNKENITMTINEAELWVIKTGQHLLHDKDQVGKWINAMVKKWGQVEHVSPNHGAAYHALVDRQRGAWTQTVENVFNDPAFKYIRVDLLVRLIHEYNRHEIIPGKNKMKEEIQRLCIDKRLGMEWKDRTLIYTNSGSIQRTVWRKIGLNNFVEDESIYGDFDINERWVWKWRD
jgi:thiamine pyrophosphokinase